MTDKLTGRLEAFRDVGEIPCACAMRVAEECGAAGKTVGQLADREGLRVSLCQLGLFGYEAYGEKRSVRRLASIPTSVQSGIRAACVGDGLACAAAWKLADASGLPRLLVGSAAETLAVRISDCQLGCFE
jgi:hypothetical protein